MGLLFIDCSVQSGYRIKSFFFDGVPNPNAIVLQDTIVNATLEDTLLVTTSSVKEKITPIAGSIHHPFKERKCFNCHDERNRTKGKLPLIELCYSCHDGFKNKYSVNHGPVETGRCTMCHNPHKSEEIKLLYSVKQDLCLQCHESHDVMANTFHANIGEQSCFDCHNPHGGENSNFLKKESCLQCHTNIIENKNNLHGPVDAGECAICHLPHEAKEPKLLVSIGNTLCLGCHDNDVVYSKGYHVKKNKQNCSLCHDPHGSNETYLLIKPPKS